MLATLRPAVVVFTLLTLITGVAYPLVVTGIAQLAFPFAANGSIVTVDGKAVGSALIGQSFAAPKYFWSRPSATSPQPYNGASSGGSNLGPSNPALGALDIMHLATPASAVLSAVIFNALIIVVLIPLALKGVRYRPLGAATLLRRNLVVYGLGGIVVPFIGIKVVDLLLVALHLV